MELDEKERIKNSFQKVKEDIETLKTQLNDLKRLIEENQKLSPPNIPKKEENTELPQTPQVPQEITSTGNEGVYANIHSFIHAHMHSFNKHSTNIQQINKQWLLSNIKEVDSLFLTLTKGEFLCFLTIYQLEEDIQRGVSYAELSRHMSLSEGCIRTYLSQMLKKGAPIQKIRLNNKLTLLSINKEFRSLNLKSRLLTLLSKSDPTQTTLF